MKQAKMEELLVRFMDGETSVEEETALAGYFRNATDDDKPADMPDEDWKANRERFRVLDEDLDRRPNAAVPPGRHSRRWFYLSGAACAAAVCAAIMLGGGEKEAVPIVAEALPADTATAITAPIDTVTSADSAQKDIVPKPAPKKQRRLPYTPPIPRNMLAQAAEADVISEDSMAVALEETEHLIKAMTVYQEIRVEEICNVEFEEEEYYY